MLTALPQPRAAETPTPHALTSAHRLYVVLVALFVSCLVLGDLVGGKLISTPVGPVSAGLILFPVTFLLTDVINDFYGRKGARFVTLVGAAMASLAYVALILTAALPTDPDSYFLEPEYRKIFGGSARLFVASIIAYLIGQFLDISVFQYWKRLTESRHLWLRATGSTILSQLVDTITITVIFWGGVADKTPGWIAAQIFRSYLLKLGAAVALTPLVYAVHGLIVRWLKITPEPVHRPGNPGTGAF